MNPTPILLYHAVTDSASEISAPFAVTPDNFARQLDLIVEHGYRCVTISQLVDEMREPNLTEQTRTLAVTFDDGYADFATRALPALTTRSIPSTLYLTSGWLNGGSETVTNRPSDEMLDWSQIPELVNAGVEIGAHSHTHPQMDTLDSLAATDELTRSKALVEDATGDSVRSFSYPHGYNGKRIRNLTSAAGYQSAVGVRNAFSHQCDNVFNLARMTVMASTSLETFKRWLDGEGAELALANESYQTTGWRAYRRAKALITGKPGSDYL